MAEPAARRQAPMTEPAFRSLPAAETFTVASPDGAVLPVYALGGPAGAPGLLVGHANGFAAGSYESWLRALAADLRVFAFDARGHGGALWPPGPLDAVFHVDRFADDLALVVGAVAARLGGGALHLCGHSLGAAAALRLAARGVSPWASAILFEPPVFPPRQSPDYVEALTKQRPLIERSAQRRSHWSSPEALCALLGSRGAFAGFRPDLLATHCRATLRPLPDGGFALACPPAVESIIFESHRDADTWQRLPAIRDHVRLVSGDPALPERGWISAVLPAMTAQIPGAALEVLPGRGHMMIFEDPERCRRLVLAAVATHPK